ncbi:MAG: class II glutamine amidotransferase [Myxococcales bacterium]|nr:class II glutamine amidotransferase [Myxococcales bacterium]
MCRLLGIAASEPTDFRIVLRDMPRSLAALSEKHPDGWGLAVFADETTRWSVKRGTETAHKDQEFHACAGGSRGVLLVSHIRLKTVGPTSICNTHPFESDGWVFAHNGTIKDLPFLRSRVSEARLARVRGDTDSELLFAWLLTELDRAGVTQIEGGEPESVDGRGSEGLVDDVVARVVREVQAHTDLGAVNFLLSNGRVMYAHRLGRTLFILSRGPHDEVRRERTSEDGMTVYTPWSQRRQAVFIASERMTDEPWEEVAEGQLLRIDRFPQPSLRIMAVAERRAGPVSAA